MGQSNRGASAWLSLAVLLAVLLSPLQPAIADDTAEREQLTTLTRQLDLIERLAEHAATTAPQARVRYHFDYTRLHQDIERIRAGIHDYLTPPRAQPRDPVELLGDYRQSNRPSDEEATQ